MINSTFIKKRELEIKSRNLTYQVYTHPKTGAQHIHLACDDPNNVFLVGFLTVPQDSSGVAHILEHTALCGSRRFPVRDPFFMMLRRSLNTFMNAFTSSDWTAYPFATQNQKDFDNLLQVYLDAAFFPNLDSLDFAQEGHRLEFSESDNPNSSLIYKGVVFNEMKGAMSSALRLLSQTLQSHLFPTITYHHNSGGEPLEIPKLTHEQLKAFHKTHYHPSNAVFMTYGNFDPLRHQQLFEEQVLQHFDKLELDLTIPDEQRYTQPQFIETSYPDDSEQQDNKTHIVIGWLLGHSGDIYQSLENFLLNGVLLGNSNSPLRYFLETSELGTAPSPLCGFHNEERESSFICGLEGSQPEHAQQLEKQIFEVLQQVVKDGIPQNQIDSVLHQVELGQREISGDCFPFGLRLLVNILPINFYGGDPVEALDLDPVLEKLRENCQNPHYIPDLIKTRLLDNPHRVRLVMKPSASLAAEQFAQEKEQLAQIQAQLTETEKQRIIEQAQALQERQQQADDPNILPKVTLEDIPPDLTFPESEKKPISNIPSTWFARGTNGLVYQSLMIELPELDSELLDLLDLFCDCLTEVGYGELDYRQTAEWYMAVTGGIGCHLSYRSDINDIQKVRSLLRIYGKSLVRNQQPLTDILSDMLNKVHFDEFNRLRELISQYRTDVEHGITDQGHILAMIASSSGISPSAALTHRWNGLQSIQSLKLLDKSFKQTEKVEEFAGKLDKLRQILLDAPKQLLVISEADKQAALADYLNQRWQGVKNPSTFNPLQLTPVNRQIKQGWRTNTQVNFCAKAYPTVGSAHPDAAVLMVLGDFLRNNFLHRAIREQGGAYGGGANYNGENGAFRFFSYRDPRLEETLQDFDNALDWLQNTVHSSESLEESILSTISKIDRPGSPAGEAVRTFLNSLHGRSEEQQRQLRQQVLQVTLDDLQRVAMTYLQPERGSVAVVSNHDNLQKVESVELEIHTLT